MWRSIRQFLNDIHLYAGLLSAVVVIAVCFTGTLYVYNTEIREFFDSERYFTSGEGNPKTLEELKSGLQPLQQGNLVSVTTYSGADRTVQFQVKPEGEEKAITYFVDPYSGEVLADNAKKTTSEELMGYVFSMHRWLLLDKVETPILESMTNQELGRLINGIATSLFLLGVLTGIFLWLPKKAKNWKQALKIKWHANWIRINHDLHNTLAFYSLIALFIMAVTGPFWSFGWYKTGWQKTWDIYQAPKEEPKGNTASNGFLEPENSEDSLLQIAAPEVSLDQLLALTNQQLPYEGNVRFTLPEDAEGEIGVSKFRIGFFARAGADQLKFNPSKLEVKEIILFGELPVRQQIGKSVKALHTGEIFGQFTKFLWVISCAIATSLPITGTLIWWNKRSKKGKKKFQSDVD
ncbi:MAG: PepSY-associated TM helix domain-containing protein [Bacteroidetes bacterium]|nr:PepSY-associated TM helix domain-containing protein [Bacteroidota bacterium]MDA1269313.1 PepSY-associated TM helix domain-containing protein [Bacteroidota bacterium]